MAAINRPGTVIRVRDGRVATTVYNGLDGVGVMFGYHEPQIEDFQEPDCEWVPDAMLRDPYPSAALPCVGAEYTILSSRDGISVNREA